ncbi:hypothetical protein U0Q88_003600 [Lactiplantibacillus plantarum]|uniref:hypothetical protein n=1 Tax=Lactiplantibacillus plantarum TaxID=1590 RepID=UPI000D1FF213|nr:hypothetical protein [Lactiplantibacillus plantarum]AVV99258.1 hypothetical protein DA080_08680 [Lactiplantibacillus plantarum]AVW07843.1 hypothetical protein DA076_08875 [Lactiplantibacillus plantarum]MCC9314311.1 hypothetical protein [Lactiplantibacillus plantarum]MDF3263997.1 hypothetical protein [Lactiplantibacillus plantarum]MDO1602077.1 hypothetical protein [Lactiplantibacillus plantarum]
MENINITTVSVQPDNVYKINFSATYESASHIEGFVLMKTEDYRSKTGDQQVAFIKQTINDNLSGKITPVSELSTDDSHKL